MSPRVALLTLVTLLAPAAAGAVTIRDIIELTKAGLSDAVLTAVIDADRTIFTLDARQILELKEAGVSETVLLKMLRTRREFERPADVSPGGQTPIAAPTETAGPVPVTGAAPGLVVIGSAPPACDVTIKQYFIVPAPLWGRPPSGASRGPAPPVLAPEHRGFGRFINDGWIGRP